AHHTSYQLTKQHHHAPSSNSLSFTGDELFRVGNHTFGCKAWSPNPSLVLKITRVLSRGKCQLPAPWRTAREMEESQLVAEMNTVHLLETAVFS
ncbi:unnamed protein product, partial [Ectocarpus sp. 4 AP-2014]